MRFETRGVREAVDEFKSHRTTPAEIRVKVEFAVLDRRIRELEATAATQSEEERVATRERIADLKHRRELHWNRYLAPPEELPPVRVAQRAVSPPPPVAEQVAPDPSGTPIPIRRALAVSDPAWQPSLDLQESMPSSRVERDWAARLDEPFAQAPARESVPTAAPQRSRRSNWVIESEPRRRPVPNYDSRRVQAYGEPRVTFRFPFIRRSAISQQPQRVPGARRVPVYQSGRPSDGWFR